MTLRRKIGSQILAMIVGLLLVSGAALWGVNGLHQDYGLALQGYQELRQVYTIGSHLSTARKLLTLPHPGEAEQRLSDREVLAAAADFQSLGSPSLASVTGGPPLDAVRRALGDAEASVTSAAPVTSEATVDGSGPPGAATAMRLNAQQDAVNRALGGIADLAARIREATESQQRAALAKRRQTIATVGALSGAVVLAGILLGILQYRSVIRPLRRLSEGVRKVAAGQFSDRVRGADGGRDEFASLARDFNLMAEELDGLYRELERKVEAKSRELVRSERLAGVGYLAAGVAHEINNPLGIIAGYAEYSLSLLSSGFITGHAGSFGPGSLTAIESMKPLLSEAAHDTGIGGDRSREAIDSAPAGESELARNLRVICDEAFRCKRITEKLLSLARPSEGAAGGEPRRRRVSLGAAAAETASVVGGLRPFQDRRLRVEADGGGGAGGPGGEALSVLADEGEMKQMLLNLTLNALEAVPPGGEVRIELSRAGSWVELAVSDNGRGMSDETLRHVFEPFFSDRRGAREDSPSDAAPTNPASTSSNELTGREREAGLRGTGLGLSITHAIVHAHGGRIEAFSDGPGRGSRFVVTLPAAPRIEGTPAEIEAGSRVPGGPRCGEGGGRVTTTTAAKVSGGATPAPGFPRDPRVLVVEDESRMRELLLRVLTTWGFDVEAARSAEEAGRLAEARSPEVVVLDLNLPGEGGIDFFKRLRTGLPRVQGIILTGFASLEAAREAIHLDVVEFLTKPCHLGELERALDRAIRRLAPPGKPVVGPKGLEAPAGPPPAAPPRDEAAPFADPSSPAGRTLEEVEREHILAALQRHGGNRTATAAELGISRRTLYYKMEGYQRQGYL